MLPRFFTTAACCVVLLAAATTANAQPAITFENLSASYTPGQDITFTVRLTGAQDLASYNIDLLLTADDGFVAGIDYAFASAVQSPERYVFNPHDGVFLAAINPPGVANRLTLSDFLFASSQTTVAGVNDFIADVTISTSAAFTGPLVITTDVNTLELTDLDFNPVAGFDNVVLPQSTVVVPEPASLALLATAGLLLTRRRRA